MCEIKFYSNDVTVDKAYYKEMQNRQGLLEEELLDDLFKERHERT